MTILSGENYGRSEKIVEKEKETTRVLVKDAKGNILILRKGPKSKEVGKYEFPGGNLDPGETREQAAIRELGEEAGIVIGPEMLNYIEEQHIKLDVSPQITASRAIYILVVQMRSTRPEIDIDKNGDSNHDSYMWVTEAQLRKMRDEIDPEKPMLLDNSADFEKALA